jgi:hypothetical protein
MKLVAYMWVPKDESIKLLTTEIACGTLNMYRFGNRCLVDTVEEYNLYETIHAKKKYTKKNFKNIKITLNVEAV